MAKIKSFEDLKLLRESLNAPESGKEIMDSKKPVQVRVAMATCGIASGARVVMDFFKEELEKRNIDAIISKTGCMGYCYAEPTVEVTVSGKEPLVFGDVNKAKADEIIEKYIKNGELVDGIIPVTYLTIDK